MTQKYFDYIDGDLEQIMLFYLILIIYDLILILFRANFWTTFVI